MRSKEEAHDYRYFPEPDLQILHVSDELKERVAEALPELPQARRRRFVEQYGIPAYDAGVLTAARDVADYFEGVAAACGDAKAASNWVMGEVLRELKESRIEAADYPVPAAALGELVSAHGAGEVSSSAAKKVLGEMLASGRSAREIVDAFDLGQVSDDDAIESAAREVLDANEKEVQRYLGGRNKLLQFFVGQVMKATRGKANPQIAAEILKRLLDERR
jgi:aspartyl-tRNA(Asn)/glutamyl-tRNA(Gln) amidotransferase subunit B